MIKVLSLCKTKRKPTYYKLACPHCGSELVCELDDIWMDDPYHDIGRITCPVCRTKFNFWITVDKGNSYEQQPFWSGISAKEIDEDTYNNAHMDASKSRLKMLIDEKEAEDEEVNFKETHN